MNIPLDFVKDINPSITDPLSKSTVYTFVPGPHQCSDSNEVMIFKFPYSENTYWTHFKYATSLPNIILESELHIVTDDGYKFIILQQHPRHPSKWYDTVWPLPSVNTSNSGIYLKIKAPTENVRQMGILNAHLPPAAEPSEGTNGGAKPVSNDQRPNIIVHLSGFIDLLPSVEQYIITSVVNTPSTQLAISKKYNIIHKIDDYEQNSPNILVINPILI